MHNATVYADQSNLKSANLALFCVISAYRAVDFLTSQKSYRDVRLTVLLNNAAMPKIHGYIHSLPEGPYTGDLWQIRHKSCTRTASTIYQKPLLAPEAQECIGAEGRWRVLRDACFGSKARKY